MLHTRVNKLFKSTGSTHIPFKQLHVSSVKLYAETVICTGLVHIQWRANDLAAQGNSRKKVVTDFGLIITSSPVPRTHLLTASLSHLL